MIKQRQNQTLEDFLRLENRTIEEVAQASNAHSPFFYALLGAFLTFFILLFLALLGAFLYTRKQANIFSYILPRLGRFMDFVASNFQEVRQFFSQKLTHSDPEPHPSAPAPEIRLYPALELEEIRRFISQHTTPAQAARAAVDHQF